MVARFTLLLAIASLAALSCSSVVHAHSFLTKPVARDQRYHSDKTNTLGCPPVGGRATNLTGTVTSFRAGEEIDVRYWRNNHAGGFIRWSLAPRGDESHDALDKHAFYYTCRESGPTCVPKKNPNQPMTGDHSPTNTLSCGDKITLPDWLPKGDYVLQWTWFGVGHSAGNLGWAEPQFRSCADIKLTTSGTKTAPPKCPTFVGGDRVTRVLNKTSEQCFYFYTTDIVDVRYKGSNDESIARPLYKFGKPAAITRCSGGGEDNSNATDSSHDGDDDGTAGNEGEVTLPPATTKPSTTKSPKPESPMAPETPETPETPKPPKSDQPSKAPKPAATSSSCRRKED